MEHLERAGIHSGDSISVYPTQHINIENQKTIIEYTKKIAKELNVIGVLNIQFIINRGNVYIIEVNPRSSRTVPYISKVTNLPVIDIATRVILGEKLKDMEYGTGIYKKSDYIAVKMPIFSFEKIKNADTSLGPEMKSTGEVLGVSKDFSEAILKAFIASGVNIPYKGNVLITVRDKDKIEMLPIAQKLDGLGFHIYATSGTAKFLNDNGVEAEVVQKIWEGENSTRHSRSIIRSIRKRYKGRRFKTNRYRNDIGNTSMNFIQYKDRVIEYKIIRKNIKNIYISIKDGAVIVTAPKLVPEKEIKNLVTKKVSWIYKNLNKSIKKEEREDLYTKEEFLLIVQEIAKELINITGIRPNKMRVRTIKYAWGSCSSNKNITINSKLIKYSKNAIRYVILHEFCHIRYMNHSKDFWALVAKYMPDYKEVKKELRL